MQRRFKYLHNYSACSSFFEDKLLSLECVSIDFLHDRQILSSPNIGFFIRDMSASSECFTLVRLNLVKKKVARTQNILQSRGQSIPW